MRRILASIVPVGLVLVLGFLSGCGDEPQQSAKVKAFLDDYEQVVAEFEQLAAKGPLDDGQRQRLNQAQQDIKARSQQLQQDERFLKEDLERFANLTVRLKKAVAPPAADR